MENNKNSTVIYEENVTQLAANDLKNRRIETFVYVIIELVLLSLIIYFVGLILLPLYFIIAFFILPLPKIWVPKYYQITVDGIIIENKMIIKYDKIQSIFVNDARKYISLRRRFRSEMVKLYSMDPKKLNELIKSLILK